MVNEGVCKHPYYAFGGDHPEKKIRAMVFDPANRAPHLSHPDGKKLVGADWGGVQANGGASWNETETSALQKAALIIPYECTCYRRVTDFPCEKIGDDPPAPVPQV